MNPALSQRAGRAMSSRTFLFLDPDTRSKFVEAVTGAKDFDDLPAVYQALITAAENEPEEDPVLQGRQEPPAPPA